MMSTNEASRGTPPGPKMIGDLFDAHSNALLLYARQLCDEPADIVQQAFMKLAGESSTPDEPLAWLYRVVRNEALLAFRGSKRRRQREFVVASTKENWFAPQVGDAIDASVASDAISHLPDELREIVVAHVWGSQSFQAIGTLLGISASSAYRRYQEALSSLRDKMGIACKTIN